MHDRYTVIIIGGGHAGVEAAWAAANLLAEPGAVALVTLDPSKVGVMSCNPAIGGLAKGQMVREIDALGGLMALATDATGIMFKMLNTSKGPAVHGPRAQCDKHAYAERVQQLIASRTEIDVIAGSVEEIVVERGRVRGVRITPRGDDALSARTVEVSAPSVVLTTGTFMRGLMHTGEQKTAGGRAGEKAAAGIAASLRTLGFEMGRLKTGTPPRLNRSTIDWEGLDVQEGDPNPIPFSELTKATGNVRSVVGEFPVLPQTTCRVTRTNADIHDVIRANLDRAPIFSGDIESVGPRYCPSIEDKVVRFADRDSHGVFLEPESLRDEWVYCNGISTSLPRDVQDRMVRAMPGCERAEILQYGYAVEYDMVRPHQIYPTGMTRAVEGLFLAGQINGTSGYEEAAGQGLVAGVNAVRFARGQSEWTLGRDESYIGVMMDDLVCKTPVEPYRMFTSRAEHRLLLRADNAPDRLTPIARTLGLLDMTDLGRARIDHHEQRSAAIARIQAAIDLTKIDGTSLAHAIRRPEFMVEHLQRALPEISAPDSVWRTVHAERRYESYVIRQRAEIRRNEGLERRQIPGWIEFDSFKTMRSEAREALVRFRPTTFGRAARLEGVTPADMTLLTVLIERAKHKRAGAAT